VGRCAIALAVLSCVIGGAATGAVAQSETFRERWRDAERRYQVLDLRGYADRMAALATEAASLPVPEHSYFFLSAARSACFTGDASYRSFAETGLAALAGAGDKPLDGTSVLSLRSTLSAYAQGSASLVYPDRNPSIGLRDARGWGGSVISFFGPKRDKASRGGGSVRVLDLQAWDYGERSWGPDEDYLALELTYCAGTRGQPHIALTDLPARVKPRARLQGQAFGLRPKTRVRVTWRHRPRGDSIFAGPLSCTTRTRALGRAAVRRTTLAVSGQTFSFRAPRQPGCWLLTVEPIGQSAGAHPRRRYSGKTQAMVRVGSGPTKLRRDFTPLPG
jgi:hypothetical protein